jgi:hypothetical protein
MNEQLAVEYANGPVGESKTQLPWPLLKLEVVEETLTFNIAIMRAPCYLYVAKPR